MKVQSKICTDVRRRQVFQTGINRKEITFLKGGYNSIHRPTGLLCMFMKNMKMWCMQNFTLDNRIDDYK